MSSGSARFAAKEQAVSMISDQSSPQSDLSLERERQGVLTRLTASGATQGPCSAPNSQVDQGVQRFWELRLTEAVR
jgi:hypothetical protein